MSDKKHIGPGQPDYGHNNPTGGTESNKGNLNPQGPTSGTENYHPERKGGKQTAPSVDTDQNVDEARNRQSAHAPTYLGKRPVPANAGGVQDAGGDSNPGAGAGDTRGQHSFRCADAGFSDCRWEVSMSSSDQLWDEIQRHAGNVHGMKSLDERTRGKIQDVIRVRRAA